MSDEGPDVGEGVPQQDLSVPMWVWTLIGFALVTAVLIIVIIRGGARDESAPTPDDSTDAAETRPAEEELIDGGPAATQPG